MGCCRYICPDKDPASLHLHRPGAAAAAAAAATAAGALRWRSGGRPGGQIKIAKSLKLNVASFIETPTSGSGIYWKEASTCWDLLCSPNSSPITKQTQHFKDEMFNDPNKSFLEVWGLFGAPLFYLFPLI